MRNYLSTERSLMYVQQQHIDHFCEVAKKMESFWHIVEENTITSKVDSWNTAFNCWVILLPDDFRIVKSAEKSLYYTPSFLVLDALIEDPNFKNLKVRTIDNDKLRFLSALTIASGIKSWGLYVVEKYNLEDFLERNRNIVYHDLHKTNKSEIDSFLQEQARYTKAVVKELNSTTFQKKIKESCNNVYKLYVDNFK